MTRPRLLDLFCGAGGAAMGYARAGFDVTGVDIKPQPRYQFEFVQADAIDTLVNYTSQLAVCDFDAIHASPVCKTFARVTAWRGDRSSHPDTLTPTLELLARFDIPYVVENVPEACPPLRGDLLLCGSQFGLKVKRHRAFQFGNWGIPYGLMAACLCGRALPFMHKQERAYADAMGCTWMPKEVARQAIPPAYTEYVGRALLEHLRERAA